MKAHIERDILARGYSVRIVADGFQGQRTWAPAVSVGPDGFIVYKEQEFGSEVEPLLRLTFDEMEAIVSALDEVSRSSDATIDALKDTRTVRDRLLSLVESLAQKGAT